MKQISLGLLPFVAILIFVSACKSDDVPETIVKEKLTGYSQKGPFVGGTAVNIQELDSDFNQTGNVYSTAISGDDGGFEFNGIELSSGYAILNANGYYFDELTGGNTKSQLALSAVCDLSDVSNVNINVLTHLEKERVLHLVGTGISFKNAKEQAKNEVLAIFGLDNQNIGNSETLEIVSDEEGNGVLLALSIILLNSSSKLSNTRQADLTELMNIIIQDIKGDGILNDEKVKSNLYNWATVLDSEIKSFENIKKTIERKYTELGIPVRIPNFEQHINSFIGSQQPFDFQIEVTDVTCPTGNDGSINLTVIGGTPPFRYTWFDTNGNEWFTEDINDLQPGIYGGYVKDANNYRRNINDIEISVGTVEIEVSGEVTHISENGNPGGIDIIISGGAPPYEFLWSDDTTAQNKNNVLVDGYHTVSVIDSNGCEASESFRVYKMISDIDGKTYRTITIGTQVWMADNLATTKFNDGTPIPLVTELSEWIDAPPSAAFTWYNNDQNTYGDDHGALYNYYTFLENNPCPTGWHVPDYDEWETLLNFVGDSQNEALNLVKEEVGFNPTKSGWRIAYDSTEPDFVGLGNQGLWWTTYSYSATDAWCIYVPRVGDGVLWLNYKPNGLCIRCVKD